MTMRDYRPKIEQRILHQVLRALLLLSLALFQTSLAPTFWRFRVDWVLLAVVGWVLFGNPEILRGHTVGILMGIASGAAMLP